jgi:hypothetical protein
VEGEASAVPDQFGGANFGQAVVTYGDMEIVKVQHGKPAGIGNPRNPSAGEVKDFKDRIALAASLSEKAYDKIFSDMLKISSKGYSIDSSKPGNLLVDAGGFGFVDLNKLREIKDPRKSGTRSVAVMLSGNPNNFNKFLSNDAEAVRMLGVIEEKLTAAASKAGFSTEGVSEVFELARKPIVQDTANVTPSSGVW